MRRAGNCANTDRAFARKSLSGLSGNSPDNTSTVRRIEKPGIEAFEKPLPLFLRKLMSTESTFNRLERPRAIFRKKSDISDTRIPNLLSKPFVFSRAGSVIRNLRERGRVCSVYEVREYLAGPSLQVPPSVASRLVPTLARCKSGSVVQASW